MPRNLVLNIAPAHFPDVPLVVGHFPFVDKAGLAVLRHEFAATHVFRRNGNQIDCVPYVAQAPEIGETFSNAKLVGGHRLTVCLVRDTLIRHVKQLGRSVHKHDPLIFDADTREDLLLKILPANLASTCWLSVRPQYEISVRPFFFPNQQPFIGVVMHTRIHNVINRPCSALIQTGFNVFGRYVGRLWQSDGSGLAPRFTLLGRVDAIDGDFLVINKGSAEEVRVAACEAFLEARPDNFNTCLSLAFGRDGDRIRQKLEVELGNYRSGPNVLNRLTQTIQYLNARKLEIVPNAILRLGNFLAENPMRRFPKTDILSKPVYVFDMPATMTHLMNAVKSQDVV